MSSAPVRLVLLLSLPAIPGCGPVDVDSGEAAMDDTGEPYSPGGWPALNPAPAWESLDVGVATGLGFGDFDQDGDPDLVVAYGNDIRAGPIAIYFNEEGRLGTEPGWTGDVERFHGHLSVGDLDGNGLPDVAVSVFLGDAGWNEPGGVDVYLNRGGVLEGSPSWSAEGFYSFSNTLGDVDLDGDLDLAVAVGEAYYHSPDRSRLYLNDGTGDFGSAAAWLTEEDRHSFDAAFFDVDADGYLDLAFANSGSAHTLYLGGADGLASTPSWTADGERFEGNTLDWGDVNGDGNPDLTISDNEQLYGDGRVRVYCGPSLEVCWESEDESAMQSAVSLEDVDGDRRLELVAGAWRGADSPPGRWGHYIRIYDNTEEGLSTEPSWYSLTDDIVVEAFAWADVDGSHAEVVEIRGEGLVSLPSRGRVLSVEGGVAGDGYLSGPGQVWASMRVPEARDLAVSDWVIDGGNLLFTREE